MAKLFGVETSFTNHRGMALPGMISDTHMYIVSGTNGFVVDDDHPAPYRSNGRAVYLDERYSFGEGVGEVAMLVEKTQIPYGVLVNSQAFSPAGGYNDGDAANVITFGRVWMVASTMIDYDRVIYNQPVYIREGFASAVTGNMPGGIKTRWFFTGAYHKKAFINENGEERDIVEVMVIPGGLVKQPEVPTTGTDTEVYKQYGVVLSLGSGELLDLNKAIVAPKGSIINHQYDLAKVNVDKWHSSSDGKVVNSDKNAMVKSISTSITTFVDEVEADPSMHVCHTFEEPVKLGDLKASGILVKGNPVKIEKWLKDPGNSAVTPTMMVTLVDGKDYVIQVSGSLDSAPRIIGNASDD